MSDCALCRFSPTALTRLAAEEALEDLEGIGNPVLGKFMLPCDTCAGPVCAKHRFQCITCEGVFCGRHVPTTDHPRSPSRKTCPVGEETSEVPGGDVRGRPVLGFLCFLKNLSGLRILTTFYLAENDHRWVPFISSKTITLASAPPEASV